MKNWEALKACSLVVLHMALRNLLGMPQIDSRNLFWKISQVSHRDHSFQGKLWFLGSILCQFYNIRWLGKKISFLSVDNGYLSILLPEWGVWSSHSFLECPTCRQTDLEKWSCNHPPLKDMAVFICLDWKPLWFRNRMSNLWVAWTFRLCNVNFDHLSNELSCGLTGHRWKLIVSLNRMNWGIEVFTKRQNFCFIRFWCLAAHVRGNDEVIRYTILGMNVGWMRKLPTIIALNMGWALREHIAAARSVR